MNSESACITSKKGNIRLPYLLFGVVGFNDKLGFQSQTQQVKVIKSAQKSTSHTRNNPNTGSDYDVIRRLPHAPYFFYFYIIANKIDYGLKSLGRKSFMVNKKKHVSLLNTDST